MPRARPRRAARRGLLAAALLAAAVAAPAQAVTVNVSRSGVTGTPLMPVELKRGDLVIGRGSTDAVGGDLNINSGSCWSGYTPQILPGDVVTVGADAPMTVRDMTIDSVTVDATPNTTVTGTSSDLTGLTVDIGGAGVAATATTGNGWTATLPGTGPRVTATAAGTIVENPAGPNVDAPCGGSPFRPNAISEIDGGHIVHGAPIINQANVGTDVRLRGPGSGTLQLGALAPPPAVNAASGIWSSTFSAAGLADGTINATMDGVVFPILKDTTSPGAPTSTPPPGRYLSPPTVALAPEAGSVVHYTTDGSTPTMASPVYTAPLRIAATQTVRAFAVDGADNPSQLVSLLYQIGPAGGGGGGDIPGVTNPPGNGGNPPGGGNSTTPGPKITGVTMVKRVSLGRLRAKGLTTSVELGTGTTAVRFTVYRRVVSKRRKHLKLVASSVRVPGHAGTYKTKLNARALGLTRPGLYEMKIVPGLSRSTLDQKAARIVWIRVTR